MHRTEAGTKPSFTTNQARPQDLVSFAFALTMYVNLTQSAHQAAHGHGLEDNHGQLQQGGYPMEQIQLDLLKGAVYVSPLSIT